MAKRQKNAPAVGVYVWLGPNLRGIMQTGMIFRGTKAEIIKGFPPELLPEAEKLVVEDKDLLRVKAMIEQGGNPYSHAFKKLLNA